jgi:hypothetical protein
MPLTHRPRPTAPVRRTALVAALCGLLAMTAAAGCGRGDDQPDPSGGGGLGGAPTTAPTTGAPAPPPPPPPPAFPGTAREYAEAVIGAWTGGDLGRLGDLTNDEVHDQLLQIPGPPAGDWTFIECDTGHYCSFYNGDGDFLILLIPAASVGGADAAVQVSYNATTYPDDDIEYTRQLVEAWRNGNLGRMQLLAVPEAVTVLTQITPGQVSAYGRVGGGGGLSIVMVSGVGFEFEAHVRTMFLGEPQAVGLVIREV